jgi:hypothetical protein
MSPYKPDLSIELGASSLFPIVLQVVVAVDHQKPVGTFVRLEYAHGLGLTAHVGQVETIAGKLVAPASPGQLLGVS